MTCRILVAFIPVIAFTVSCHRRDTARRQPVATTESAVTQASDHLPVRIAIVAEETGVEEPEPKWRWGRVEHSSDNGRYSPNRADWHENAWELRAIADVPSIPDVLRPLLARLDCAIPRYRSSAGEGSVIWGEFDRAGQRDVAILCVHADQSSSTYVFWSGDPARMEVMPSSGNVIRTLPRTGVEASADPALPLQPDMPTAVRHDALGDRVL